VTSVNVLRMAYQQDARTGWRFDVGATSDLAPLGPPFADPRFLAALEDLDAGWSTQTLGAALEDGTRAVLSLGIKGSRAESVPYGYGGIVADRALEATEVASLLKLVCARLEVRTIRCRYVPLPVAGRPAHACGTVVASTPVVPLAPDQDVEAGLAKRARQSIRRARRAGVVVSASSDPAAFLRIYADASKRFSSVYPRRLTSLLAEAGLGRVYDAAIDGEVVASAYVLMGGTEWMYWLAGQTERGRLVEAGYPLVAELLSDARTAGVRWVNLGASTGLPGVASFKRRMNGVDLPVIEQVLVRGRLRFMPRRDRPYRAPGA